MRLDTQRLQTLDQIRQFLADNRPLDLRPQTRAEAYAFVAETLERFDYPGRGKADKGLLRRFLVEVAGLSRAQVTRLLRQHRTTGAIADRRGPRRPFPRRYTKADIGLLAEVDALHGTLSGPATRQLCIRALHVFGDRRFERLAAVSNGHLYNLRHSTSYQRRRGTMPVPTRPAHIAIGDRRRPRPAGQPGYLRVDTVHQGDLDGVKGLYHLNLVDEVTQFQFVGSLERIETPCLAPVLEALLRAVPQLGLQIWALRPGLDGTSRPSTTVSRDAVAGHAPLPAPRETRSEARAPGPLLPRAHRRSTVVTSGRRTACLRSVT